MDRDFLLDLFAAFGPVTLRRMFSGFGISADEVNFALALRSGVNQLAVTLAQWLTSLERGDTARLNVGERCSS